jgi:microcin C transport system substrate-binding protein
MPILTSIRKIPAALLFAILAGVMASTTYGAQGIAQYGKPKYTDGFSHFDYVNPNAPRGGTLTLPNPDRRTSFDKFNPFTLRGVAAPGIAQLLSLIHI